MFANFTGNTIESSPMKENFEYYSKKNRDSNHNIVIEHFEQIKAYNL
jgi:hypothetical protein